MTTLIAVFVASLALVLVLTPFVREGAVRRGLLDHPDARRVHERPIPRAGGVAIYVAFLVPFLTALAIQSAIGEAGVELDASVLSFVAGATIVFVLGLIDDLRGLAARTKVVVQAIAAAAAFFGGLQISKVGIPWLGTVELGLLAAPATIFWFLLLVNAVNLIDGLDGLASGITLFATLSLLAVWQPGSSLTVAIGMAALAGVALGFLRFNFPPASIFLGDSGSYLLGFAFAGLTVMGSVKTRATAGLLIPLIALGVPLIDVLWSPLRRFILGRRLWVADRDHIHHRLLALGYTHRRAVLLLYGLTIFMGLTAVLVTHAQDEHAAALLVMLAAAAILGIRRLGYVDFVRSQRVRRWLADLADELGLARQRRAFLAREVAIEGARSAEELAAALRETAEDLGLIALEVAVTGPRGARPAFLVRHGREVEAAYDPALHIFVSMPLSASGAALGFLRAVIPMERHAESPHLLRRIDQLRAAVLESGVASSPRAALRAARGALPAQAI